MEADMLRSTNPVSSISRSKQLCSVCPASANPAHLLFLNTTAVCVVAGTALAVFQVGFVAIRELAVLLRNALSAKTQDAHKEVYCWQVRCNTASITIPQLYNVDVSRGIHQLLARFPAGYAKANPRTG
jgi:hypothetical protein